MLLSQAKDEIRIDNLEVFAHHGVFEEETRNGQLFYINAVLYTDTRQAGETDRLELSTHYGEVSLFMDKWMKENTCLLLERVAEQMSRAVLMQFPLIAGIDLEIRKPQAPIPLPFESVSVKIKRGWHRAFIAIGSNMGDSDTLVREAVTAMDEHPYMRVKKQAPWIVTEPYGGVEQDDFVNGAVEIETLCEPEELLEALHVIENAAGRERKIHWGPRTLDLDVLFYDDLIYESETLIIPHPDLENRDFVLKPMNELAPYFRHPANGRQMRELLATLRER